ncbi:hypothetical protein L3V83_03150 [Thiotrichales bacterium 19X7-9]|nr:hypothetical protein [Thiotrichales bacterium 19X7-9]
MLFFIILFLFIFNIKIAAKLALVTFLASPDVSLISFTSTDPSDALITHSIYLDKLFGFTLALLVSCCVLVMALIRVNWMHLKIHKNIALYIFLPLLIPCYGLLVNQFNIAFSSSSIFFGLLVGFWICHIGEINFKQFSSLLLSVILSVSIINIFFSLVELKGGMLFFGNIGTLFPVAIFFIDQLMLIWRFILLALLGWNLLLHPARSRIVGYLYAAFVFLLKQMLRAMIYLIIVALFVILIWGVLPDNYTGFLLWKLSSINIFDPNNVSSYTRYVELVNILHQNITNIFHFALGSGYGGTYTDQYMNFPDIALYSTAFSEHEVTSHVFHSSHLAFSDMLLYSGVILTLMFYFGIFKLTFIDIQKIKLRDKSQQLFLLYLPFWVLCMYNQLTYIVFGIFIYYLNDYLLAAHEDAL